MSFYFLYNFETYLILGNDERDMIIDVHKSSSKVPVILVRFQLYWNFLEFSKNIKYQIL